MFLRSEASSKLTSAQESGLLELAESAVLVADLLPAVVDLLAPDPVKLPLEEPHVESPGVEAEAAAAAALAAETVHDGELFVVE